MQVVRRLRTPTDAVDIEAVATVRRLMVDHSELFLAQWADWLYLRPFDKTGEAELVSTAVSEGLVIGFAQTDGTVRLW